MRKRRFVLGLMCGLILVTGCRASNDAGPRAAVDENDLELYYGDLGVEKHFPSNTVRSLENAGGTGNGTGAGKGAVLLDPHGFPLIRKFPNPKITPLKRKYVENVIATAKMYLGTPYVFGSDRTEPSSFDCSDFTRWVFLYSLGMDLPWDSRSQAAYVKAFSDRTYDDYRKARRGDLLFFTNYLGNKDSDYKGVNVKTMPISHVAIYLGNGKLIHCPSKRSGGVRKDTIKWRQLDNRFVFGGGILDEK